MREESISSIRRQDLRSAFMQDDHRALKFKASHFLDYNRREVE